MRPSRGEKYINTRVERTSLPQGISSDTKNKTERQERGNQKNKKGKKSDKISKKDLIFYMCKEKTQDFEKNKKGKKSDKISKKDLIF